MIANILPNHPKRKLLFFFAQGLDDNIRSKIRDFVLRLACIWSWVNGPPRIVNSRDEPMDTSHGDMAVEAVGGYIEIYSALPPRTLQRETDIQHFHEVIYLLNALCSFSREFSLSIEFELDGELIGAIDDGKMDRPLAEDLLGEWRQCLEL